MSIAAQLLKNQIAQRSRDVSQGSVLSGIASEKAIERGQANRALAKYSKWADILQRFGKWGGRGLGYLIPGGGIFAPAIGEMLGQGLSPIISHKGTKGLEEKYGSGHLAKIFKNMGSEQWQSGLTRAALSGLQSGLMTKFAPDMTAESIGKKGIEKHLKGLKPGDDPGIFKSLIEEHAPESLLSLESPHITANLQALGAEPQSLLSPEQIQAILTGESKDIGFKTSIMQGIYDLGFGSPTFSWDEIRGK